MYRIQEVRWTLMPSSASLSWIAVAVIPSFPIRTIRFLVSVLTMLTILVSSRWWVLVKFGKYIPSYTLP